MANFDPNTGAPLSAQKKSGGRIALIVICAQTAWQEISVQLQARGIPQDRLARYRSRDHALISV